MFLNYKNISVSLNNHNFICDDIQLSNEIQLSPVYRVGNATTEEESPNSMWSASLKISYYLSGADYLKQYIYSNGNEPISGNIAGLYFNQSYLSNYSINVEPNTPIKVNATLSIFDQITGAFIPSPATSITGFIFRSSDIQINNLQGYTQNLLNNFSKASFTYECQLTPSYNYYDTGLSPVNAQNVFLGERVITTEIVSDNTNLTLPLSGEKFGVTMLFYNPFNSGLYENFTASGKISSKQLSLNTSSPHNHSIKIVQNHVNKPGYIFSVTTGTNLITINSSSGSFPFLSRDGSLSYIDSVYIGDTQLTGYSINRTSAYDQITSPIPFNILNDILTVNTSYGNYVWPNKVSFSYPQITITGLSSITGSPGSILTISGTNFVRISDVIFGNNTESLFQVIDPQTIKTTIPSNGQSSPITVLSYYRNTSGQTTSFYYQPTILYVNPVTGVWKDTINLSGVNFSGITGVYFNNTKAFSYSIVNNTLITAQTPETGQPFPSGYIKIYGTGGYGQSIPVYNPTIPIYSFSPISGVPGIPLTIYTKIDTGYYFPFSGGYKVKVDGVDCPFFISGGNYTGALTGTIPNSPSTENDYIYIYKPDGITTSASQTILQSIGFPFISNISPSVVTQFEYVPLFIYGQNLSYFYNNNTFVRISGGVSGDIQTYTGNMFTSSTDTSTLVINNLYPTGNTGYYDVFVQNVVSGYNLPAALQVNSAVNQAQSLTPVFSASAKQSIYGFTNGIAQQNTATLSNDLSYLTYSVIAPTTTASFSRYISFTPPAATTINIGLIKSTVISATLASNPLISHETYVPIPFTYIFSGYVVCFSGLSIPAYSGFFTNLNQNIPMANGLTGINEIRVISASSNTVSPAALCLAELEVY